MEKGAPQIDGDLGPVLVTVEHEVAPDQATDFSGGSPISKDSPPRRRPKVGIFRDTENVNRYVETFAIRG